MCSVNEISFFEFICNPTIQAPNFVAFKPRDIRIPSPQAMNHISWSCDGRRLGAVGIDKVIRVWWPEKSVRMS